MLKKISNYLERGVYYLPVLTAIVISFTIMILGILNIVPNPSQLSWRILFAAVGGAIFGATVVKLVFKIKHRKFVKNAINTFMSNYIMFVSLLEKGDISTETLYQLDALSKASNKWLAAAHAEDTVYGYLSPYKGLDDFRILVPFPDISSRIAGEVFPEIYNDDKIIIKNKPVRVLVEGDNAKDTKRSI